MMKAFFFISSVFAASRMQLALQSSSDQLAIMVTDMRIGSMLRTEIKNWVDSVSAADQSQLSDLQATGKQLQLKVMFQLKSSSKAPIRRNLIQLKNGEATNSVPQSERYINYGCYCTPTSTKDENWVGTGEPVDDIDRLCRDLFYGYNCLKNDHTAKCSSKSTYDWDVDSSGLPKCGKCLWR